MQKKMILFNQNFVYYNIMIHNLLFCFVEISAKKYFENFVYSPE